jgi:hypothetical protein
MSALLIWYVLLFLVSVGLLVAALVVEARRGFYAALPLALPGFAGILYLIYLAGVHWLPLAA